MNKLHPLHSIQYVVDAVRRTGEYFDSTRRTGRSTALALKFIGQAIENPYKAIQVRDHSDSTGARQVSRDRHLVQLISEMCLKLGLQFMRFNIVECSITFGEATTELKQAWMNAFVPPHRFL